MSILEYEFSNQNAILCASTIPLILAMASHVLIQKYFKGGGWVGMKHEWTKLATLNNTVSSSHHTSIINPSLIGRAAVSPTLARGMPTLYMSSTYQSICSSNFTLGCATRKRSRSCLFHSPTMCSIPLVGVDKRWVASHPPLLDQPLQSHDNHMEIGMY